ncbi:PEGA domain-containing protein [Myxococcus sp. MxC21-1]|uniref:PEGA domain-containing protein n=1 Tax=Myxococcus sp. MxC21-1 TaxID=3041439 RepID=UPI00292E29F8|nr:PEGA domain-containing protein [Myxococcus sp. MxC21-1]WNZ62482.1 PEGA domain-containing protein [Myxococcus sp. MxC21-1]
MAGLLASREPSTPARVAAPSLPVQTPSLAPPPLPRVSIVSSPPGATVTEAGRVLGTTPLELDSLVDGGGPWVLVLEGHALASVERLPHGGRVEVTLRKLPASHVPKLPSPEPKKVRDLKPNPFH